MAAFNIDFTVHLLLPTTFSTYFRPTVATPVNLQAATTYVTDVHQALPTSSDIRPSVRITRVN